MNTPDTLTTLLATIALYAEHNSVGWYEATLEDTDKAKSLLLELYPSRVREDNEGDIREAHGKEDYILVYAQMSDSNPDYDTVHIQLIRRLIG